MKGTGHLSCPPFPRYLIDEVIVRPNPAAETDLCQGVGTETVICLWLETFREGPTPGVVACLMCVCVRAPACSVPQLWLTLCDPLDRSHRPPVHGIFQARILEQPPRPPAGAPSHPGVEPASLASPAPAGRLLTTAHLASPRPCWSSTLTPSPLVFSSQLPPLHT